MNLQFPYLSCARPLEIPKERETVDDEIKINKELSPEIGRRDCDREEWPRGKIVDSPIKVWNVVLGETSMPSGFILYLHLAAPSLKGVDKIIREVI